MRPRWQEGRGRSSVEKQKPVEDEKAQEEGQVEEGKPEKTARSGIPAGGAQKREGAPDEPGAEGQRGDAVPGAVQAQGGGDEADPEKEDGGHQGPNGRAGP